jgi:exosortase
LVNSRLAIFGALLLFVLLAVCYWSAITGMVDQWTHDEDMGHGFVVPFVAAWIAWRGRSQWLDKERRPTWWGFVPLVCAAALLYLARIGAGLFLASVALWIAIVGVVLVLGGTRSVRGLAFPLLLLLFALPKLAIVYNQITLPLQLLASRMAAAMLTGVGIHVVRQGNILALSTMTLSVAEACNGIRYLLSLSFLAIVFAYFFDAKPWMRVVLAVATVPISILANALRVALIGLAGHFNPALAAGVLHGASGWVVFAGCLVLLVGVHWLVNQFWSRVHG